jgi:ADP-glucose pyrophosphorylase
MIKYILNKFFGRKPTSLPDKLKEHLKSHNKNLNLLNIDIYIIDNFVFEDHLYALLKTQIDNKEPFIQVIKNLKKDLMKDNIVFYYLHGVDGENFLISLYDPFEYWEKETVLDIWKIDEEYVDGLTLRKLE